MNCKMNAQKWIAINWTKRIRDPTGGSRKRDQASTITAIHRPRSAKKNWCKLSKGKT